jgi:hypothetical protein
MMEGPFVVARDSAPHQNEGWSVVDVLKILSVAAVLYILGADIYYTKFYRHNRRV